MGHFGDGRLDLDGHLRVIAGCRHVLVCRPGMNR